MPLVTIPSRTADIEHDVIALSETNPGFRIETNRDGSITMSPTGGTGGANSLEAAYQLKVFAKAHGGQAYDSSQGWTLAEADCTAVMRSPDASWLSPEKHAGISERDRRSSGFLAIVPDVAIEVKSTSDRWPATLDKLALYLANGAAYVVAIDPATRAVVEHGTPPTGLVLDFDAVIDAY